MRDAGIDESTTPDTGRANRTDSAAAGGPRLLISVRNPGEARRAVSAGCDVLDVKEPTRGPLGIADLDEIRAVAAGVPCDLPLSVALGETIQWQSAAEFPPLPTRVRFAKLGLSGLSGTREWTDVWTSMRAGFDSARGASLAWVAVAYADWSSAGAPEPDEVVAAAVETNCAGVLVDTFTKDGRSLLDALGVDELIRLSVRARNSGLLFALAGRVTCELLPELAAVPADIIGIRSAACAGTSRDRSVCLRAIKRFKRALDASARFQKPAAFAAD